MADKRKGIAFQNFVAQVEKAFAARDNVTVETGKFITDIDSGSRREFDVFITSKFGGYHELTTAIEVKEERDAIGVPEIEAFLSKCGRNNISHKVMVSPKGANPAAVKLAAKTGVTIMTMAQAEAFDWLAIDAFTEHRRTFGDSTFHVEMGKGEPTPEGDWVLIDKNGEEVTADKLAKALHAAVSNDDPNDLHEGARTLDITFTDQFAVRTPDGVVYPVEKVVGKTSYTTTVTAIPLTLHEYTGAGAGDGVKLAFAAGDLKIGETGGKLVFARQSDGTTDITWQPDPAEIEKPKAVRRPRPPRRPT
jgi:hypothetical protein